MKKDTLRHLYITNTLDDDLNLVEQDSTSEHEIMYWLQEENE